MMHNIISVLVYLTPKKKKNVGPKPLRSFGLFYLVHSFINLVFHYGCSWSLVSSLVAEKHTICLLKSWLRICILLHFFPLCRVELMLLCVFLSHTVFSVFAFLSPFPFLPQLFTLPLQAGGVEGVRMERLPSVQLCLCSWGQKPGSPGEICGQALQ